MNESDEQLCCWLIDNVTQCWLEEAKDKQAAECRFQLIRFYCNLGAHKLLELEN